MRKEIEIYELIERYLNNQLSAEELSDIEARIKSYPGFASEVEKQRNIHSFIQDSSLINIGVELEKIHNKFNGSNLFLRGWRWSIIIIPVILLLSTVVFIQRNQFNHTDIESLERKTQSLDISKENHKDTVVATKNIHHTTHPQTKVQQTKALVTPTVEPEKQQENKTLPADFYFDSNEVKTKIDTQTIEIVLPEKNQSGKTEIKLTPNSSEVSETIYDDPCKQVEIFAEIKIDKSCIEKSTGKISIDKESIRGGASPYEVSISNKENFVNQLTFTRLFPGNYSVYIRDKNHCISSLGNVNIESKTCTYEYIFAPDKGEIWEVPDYQVPFTLKIYSKNGHIVFTQKIDYEGSYEWNGRTTSDDELPMGAYMFVLESDNKEPFYGTITLVR